MRELSRYINVPLEIIGNKIKSVKTYKSKVVVTFYNKNKLEIPPEIFTSHFLYKDKILNEEEIRQIEQETSSYNLYKYAKKLLLTRPYTEYKIREKLYLKEATKEEVDIVINQLRKAGLVNDNEFALEYVDYCYQKGYGKNKIKVKLQEKGVFNEIINQIKFDDDYELERANKLLNGLEKKYDRYPYKAKKDHIITALVNYGYDLDIAITVANKIKEAKSKDEEEKALTDFKKLYSSYSRRYEGRELKDKIYQALRRKGYNTKTIYKVMEEIDL